MPKPTIITSTKNLHRTHNLQENGKNGPGKHVTFLINTEQDSSDLYSQIQKQQTELLIAKNTEAKVVPTITLYPKSERQCWERFLGMILMTLSSLLFSLAVTMVKLLKLEDYLVYSIILWRFIGGVLLPSIPIILYCQFIQKSRPFQTLFPLSDKDKLKTHLNLFLRAMVGVASVVFRYMALNYLTIADTTAVAFSTPVFVTFLACICLNERFGVMNITAALITLVGIFIITRPPFLTGEAEFDTTTMIGVGLALTSMIFSAFIFLFLRVLKHVHFAVTTFSFGIFGTIASLIFCGAFDNGLELPRSQKDWLLTLALCLFTYGGQVCSTLAFKYEEAGPLSMIRSFDVIFSFVWQALFLSVIPDEYSIVGSIVVVFGVILIGFRKFLNSLPKDHPLKALCCLVLK